MGALFSLNVSAYASGNPAPTFSLVSSTADAGDYSFAGSTLSFTPSEAGEFGFVFQAQNEPVSYTHLDVYKRQLDMQGLCQIPRISNRHYQISKAQTFKS